MHRKLALTLTALATGCTIHGFAGPLSTSASAPGAIADGARGARAGAGAEAEGLGCVPDSAGAAFSSAGALRAGTVHGCIEPGTGSAVYALTAPDHAAGVLYEFRMTASSQICVKLFDAERNRHGNGVCLNDDTGEGYFWAAVDGGSTVHLRLEATHERYESPYRIEVQETRLRDPDEPNHDWRRATRLELGKPHQALMQRLLNGGEQDRDYYRIEVRAPGTLEIAVDPGSDGAAAGVSLLDADRREVARGRSQNRGAIARSSARVRPGTYYIAVGEFYSTVRPFEMATWGDGQRPHGHYSEPYRIEVDLERGAGQRSARRSKRRR